MDDHHLAPSTWLLDGTTVYQLHPHRHCWTWSAVVTPRGMPEERITDEQAEDIAAMIAAAPETAAERDRLRSKRERDRVYALKVESERDRLREQNAELLAALEEIEVTSSSPVARGIAHAAIAKARGE